MEEGSGLLGAVAEGQLGLPYPRGLEEKGCCRPCLDQPEHRLLSATVTGDGAGGTQALRKERPIWASGHLTLARVRAVGMTQLWSGAKGICSGPVQARTPC